MLLALQPLNLLEAGAGDDTTPDQFTFTEQSGASLSTTITSAAITVSGITAAAAITVTGGAYDINGSGSFTSGAGTVNNGDTVRARHASSASYSAGAHTVVTIGGVSDTFTSITIPDPAAMYATAVTASDSTTFDPPARALYVGGAGNVAVRMVLGQNNVTFVGVPAGTLLPINVDRVLSTGTTATNIIRLY